MAEGEPLVRVRADSRIELGVTHLDVGMSVTGALRDELGHGLAERTLSMSVVPVDDPRAPFETTVRTNGAGEFALEIADGNHDYQLFASFEGDDEHRGVRVERSVERARSDVRLELRIAAGSILDLDAPEVELTALAESDAGGANLALKLSDEHGRELARARTDAQGHAHFRVPSAKFGAPGAGLLRVESLEDALHAEAQTEARIMRSRRIVVELIPESERVELGTALAVRGHARTRVGPQADLPVGLFVGNQHVQTVLTDADGAFSARLWFEHGPATTRVSARVEADPSGAHPATESSFRLAVVRPEPLPTTWLLALLSAVTLVVLLAIRARRHPAPAVSATPKRAPRVRLGAPQGAEPRFDLIGIVTADQRDTPLPGARVDLLASTEHAAAALWTDAQGRFRSLALPSGRVRLRVSATGYVSATIDLQVPHRGEGTNMRVRLESLRAHALRAFREAVEPGLPFPRAFSLWTPREVRTWLAQRRPDQRVPLGELTLEVERATYAATPPSEEEVARIERHAKAISPTAEASPQAPDTKSIAEPRQ